MPQEIKINGSKIVMEKLVEMGVDTVFGYPGGAVIPLYHEWTNYASQIRHFRATHEQHAVHAADGYARATGKVGVCLVTSGPGATNTLTGIATAYMDSIPLLIISGQVPTHLIGKDSFQEVDITGMTLGITKHNFLVRSVEELADVMEKAYIIAMTGRPGPVLIDIPKDILLKEVSAKRETVFLKERLEKTYAVDEAKIQCVAQWLNEAKRPLIYAGGGVKSSGAEAILKEIAEKADCPVMTSFMGNGAMDRRHRLALGMIGMHGSVAANRAVGEADLLIAIGVRFSDRVVGNPKDFQVKGRVVHIDLDPTEHQKNLKVDLSLHADVKAALEVLNNKVDFQRHEAWIAHIEKVSQAHPQSAQVQWIFDVINEFDDEETIYCTDVGQHQMWSAQLIKIPKSRHWISSGGLGTMGFGLGAAFGAKVAQPQKRVVLITGDGSFRMNMAEMASLMDYELKVDIILFENQALGMVRQWQTLFQDHVYAETSIKKGLDYSALAHAFGFKTYYCQDRLGLKEALESAQKEKKTTLTILNLHHDEQVFPIVPPGKNLNEMIVR